MNNYLVIIAFYVMNIILIMLYYFNESIIFKLNQSELYQTQNVFRHKYGIYQNSEAELRDLTHQNNTIPPKLFKSSCSSCALFYANVS